MSLPTPNLDVRSFQQIVDDVKRQISLHCPDWTDHNVSDPGVTLIELFAGMTEMMLFRTNQVPEKNYVKFLELLGIGLETPKPAQTKLRFYLSRPIEDLDGEENNERLLYARRTVAATVRTEIDEAIEFSTDRDLKMVRPYLRHVVSIPESDSIESPTELKEFNAVNAPPGPGTTFPIYSRVPRTGDAVYFGFEANVTANLVQLSFTCVGSAATGLKESYPSQLWEVWNGLTMVWDRLEIVSDSTNGFNRTGSVVVDMPMAMGPLLVGRRRASWIRCRYTVDPAEMPAKGVQQLRPGTYQTSPEIQSVDAAVIGGTALASQCATIVDETIGTSDGTSGQVFRLIHSPVLQLENGEGLMVGIEDDSQPDNPIRWTDWTLVEDFSNSGSKDLHYVVDFLTGDVLLGPSIGQPDGEVRQYGAIPEKGAILRFSSYRIGGGTQGNVREGKIKILKTAIPYIAKVENPVPAIGGRDRETLERAKMRAREVLQVRNRAVTAEDYELLARKASPAVGRARCLQPRMIGDASSDLVPGTVRVLIIPTLPPIEEVPIPRPADLAVPDRTVDEVRRYLDERRLLTSTLDITEPDYVFVSTEIRLVADPRADADAVGRRVQRSLCEFLHPLVGGPNRDGWPFGRTLSLADIYAQVGVVAGVAFLLDARLFTSRMLDKNDRLLGPQSRVSLSEGVKLEQGELLCSRQHTIRVVPMKDVGTDADGNPIGM